MMASQEQFQTTTERSATTGSDELENRTDEGATGRTVELDDASLDESEVTVRQGDGWLAALEVEPRVECTWAGFEEPPAEVGATLMVSLDGETSFDPVATEIVAFDGLTAGSTTVSFGQSHDVVGNTTLDAVDFEPGPRATRPRTRTLTLHLVVDLLDEDGVPLCGDEATTEYEVVVEASGDGDA
jgi:hypothetical protein